MAPSPPPPLPSPPPAASPAPHPPPRSTPQPPQLSQPSGLRIRTAIGLSAFIFGAVLLTTGCLVGLITPAGVLIGFAGGTSSILAAPALLIPPLRGIPRLLPTSGILSIAVANLVQEPLRTARTVLAVTIGVALITMFTVAGTMWSTTLNHELGGVAEARAFVDGMLTAVGVLTSFSAVVAAIGVASTLSLSVLQRRRELGMLRATGITRRPTRTMLLAEAVLTTTVGTLAGLLLGVAYGFAGYTSTLGSVQPLPPQLPLPFIPLALLIALAFAAIAALTPARRAAAVPPAEALRTL